MAQHADTTSTNVVMTRLIQAALLTLLLQLIAQLYPSSLSRVVSSQQRSGENTKFIVETAAIVTAASQRDRPQSP
ncbi:MAG: hypothetical protein AAF289_03520 [Cyanobacteria bacterium P01_A01_bin.135]